MSTFAVPLAAQRAGAFVVHAAVAARGESALAICAESGTGKSSLLIALVDAGWSAVSEDLVALDLQDGAAPMAWPGPGWVRISPGVPGPRGSIERFHTSDKVAWDLDGRRRNSPVPLTRLILLDPPTDEPTSCRTAGPEEVIGSLARHTPWFEEPARRGESLFAAAVRVARSVPAVRMRLQRRAGWAEEAVALLDDLAG